MGLVDGGKHSILVPHGSLSDERRHIVHTGEVLAVPGMNAMNCRGDVE